MPPLVPRATWDAERAALLQKEKALTRALDELAAERRRMSAVDSERMKG